MGLREASPAQKISQNILHRRHTRNDRRQQLIIGCVHFITQAMSLIRECVGRFPQPRPGAVRFFNRGACYAMGWSAGCAAPRGWEETTALRPLAVASRSA